MTVDKAFCESTDSSFGRSLTCREGKSVSRICVYASEDSLFYDERGLI